MQATTSRQIDQDFIDEWSLRYRENDETEYERLVSQIAKEASSTRTIAQETFCALYKWKTRNRTRRFLRLAQYQTLYAPSFARVWNASNEEKLNQLAGDSKLPGVDTATATTIIHFLHPLDMPIMDIRTVQVLKGFGYISAESVTTEAYAEFRTAMHRIASDTRRRYRQIDRALFAYHKEMMGGRVECR